ncbi:Outer membrane protein assembly factor BamA [Ekhidna lutea]|uniref:Outer membrane protein assembly factor BamA n=1 Tax=Ekhidna lutea TaxID=447679 RepID=A0A239M7L3_EKHLU|nr:BamA/TamA family outer membrane protein [Ekhidna lutea]SNT38745.1 Outer membrane protein assembly factor BamA [Ekhidna lutea]
MKDDQQILAKQKIEGLSGSLRDGAKGLYEQSTNSRMLFGYPFVHIAHFYKLGEDGIGYKRDVERLELRKNDLKEIFAKRIEKADSTRKIELKHTLEKKIARRNNKIERVKERFDKKVNKREERLSSLIRRFEQKIQDANDDGNKKKANRLEGRFRWKKFRKEQKIERLKDYEWVGLWYFDPDVEKAEKDSLITKFDHKIQHASTDKKRQKLRNKKAKKIDKKNKTIKQGNQLMRWGEEPAIYNHTSSKLTVEKIDQYLNSKGYFDAKIQIDTANYDSLNFTGRFGRNVRNWFSRWFGAKHRYVNVDYHVDLNNRYYIDSIQYHIEDTVLRALIFESIKESPLKKGFYDQSTLSEERDFIYDLAVNNGYYEFSKQYIQFQIDSTQLGQDSLIVRELIKNPPQQSEHKIYYLDSVVFITDASIRETYSRTNESYRDITFSFAKNRYSKKVLEWRIPLEQDDPYSRDLTLETQRQLSYLDNFKFININYDTTGNYFVANIFTSPFDKFQTSSEFGLSRAQGRPGPFVNVNLKNRNTFRTLEILSFDANAKLEDLQSVRENAEFDGNYTSRQFGGEAAITFPQFLFPLGSYYKNKIGRFNPKTRISFGFSFEDRVSEYRRIIYQGTWAYSWQVKDQVKYILTPFQLSLTDATTTDDFDEFLATFDENNPYALAFNSSVVSSTAFQMDISFGDYAHGRDGGYMRLNAEMGGNLNNIFGESFLGDSLETYKYAKAQIDLRKIERLTRNTNLAARLNIGLAYPYGANRSLPYEKYFFAGGSSSIRAWKPRRLGPGAYGSFEDADGNPLEEINDNNEQRGELLIESSIELRQDLVGFLEGAVFIDAGNIWQVRQSLVNADKDPEGDDGLFKFENFVDEIAVGAGVGLRFDLQFLIFRVDLGLKLFDPGQKRGERFVGNEIFSNFDRNSEINIGIGYPF